MTAAGRRKDCVGYAVASRDVLQACLSSRAGVHVSVLPTCSRTGSNVPGILRASHEPYRRHGGRAASPSPAERERRRVRTYVGADGGMDPITCPVHGRSRPHGVFSLGTRAIEFCPETEVRAVSGVHHRHKWGRVVGALSDLHRYGVRLALTSRPSGRRPRSATARAAAPQTHYFGTRPRDHLSPGSPWGLVRLLRMARTPVRLLVR
jgi:hypothetical protein